MNETVNESVPPNYMHSAGDTEYTSNHNQSESSLQVYVVSPADFKKFRAHI